MSDSILNYGDLVDSDDLAYNGGDNDGFTGSSTLQDVQLGSPVQLDTTYGITTASVIDPINQVDVIDSESTQNSIIAQSLTGASDTPLGSAAASTPTPNSTQPNANSAAGLSALAKFGSSIATLFAGTSTAQAPAKAQTMTAGGAMLPTGGISGTNTLIVVIVVVALIALLARPGE